MKPADRISIVLPAKNEAVGLRQVLPALRRDFPLAELIVVDDGSTDDTAAIAGAAGARVLSAPYGMGNGAAIKRGARAATGEILVFMDADGQHGAQHIRALLEKLAEGYDMVVGAPPPVGSGLVAIVAAGTSDLGVAEEAALTAQWMGQPVEMLIDVGVAGLHRLLAQQDCLRRAQAIVVVAGMDGALASVVGGLVAVPVIAVPTSVGYGAHFQGLATLLAMLNSCAPGVAVVNIDNGYGAGYMAAVINAQTGGNV